LRLKLIISAISNIQKKSKQQLNCALKLIWKSEMVKHCIQIRDSRWKSHCILKHSRALQLQLRC